MKIYRIKAVMMRHAYEVRRNVDRVTDMIYWPVLDIIVWGFFTVYLAHGGRPGGGIAGFLLGAAILWGMFYSFQRDMAVGFLDELWPRNLINLFSTPLDVSEYLSGLIVVNLFKVMAGAVCAGIVPWACYAFNIFPRLPQFVPFMLNLMLFGLALGVFTSGLILRYATKVQGLAWSFAGLLLPVSCILPAKRSAAPAARGCVDAADDARVRGHAPGAGRRRIFGRAFLVGAWTKRGLLRSGSGILPTDIRVRPQPRPAGETGIVCPLSQIQLREWVNGA